MLDEVPNGWELLKFGDMFGISNDKTKQIPKSSYLKNGEIPVVDQSPNLVSAYGSGNPYSNLPVIVFGDHTRVVKWVDFDFLPGADGTQILRASNGIEPKFAYFALCRHDLKNLGYSRHMRELKRGEFLLPPLAEQQRIAEILTSVDDTIHATERVIAQTERVKLGVMEDLLTGGLGSEAIANGEVPDGWVGKSFSDLFKVANDKTKQIPKSKFADQGAFPVVDQSPSLVSGFADGEPYSEVPVIVFGDHTRVVKWVDFDFFPGADGTQILKVLEGTVGKFAYYALNHHKLPNLGYSRHMRELKRGMFATPAIEKQQQIVSCLEAIDTEILSNKALLAQTKRLKQGLMSDLLTGKKRVM